MRIGEASNAPPLFLSCSLYKACIRSDTDGVMSEEKIAQSGAAPLVGYKS